MNKKKKAVLGMMILGIAGMAFAQSPQEPREEVLTIETFYPSPWAEFEEMRLYPTTREAGNCDNDRIGYMYYDDNGTGATQDDDAVKVCKGTLLGWQELGGEKSKVVQIVSYQTGEFATGTAKIPYDDTIPQNTEGDEYMSLSITPTSATNILQITVVANATSNDNTPTMALFQDNKVNALAVTYFTGYPSWITPITINHFMQAGTTSATIFKVRLGSSNGVTYFNGASGSRRFGGVYSSSITITEIKQ